MGDFHIVCTQWRRFGCTASPDCPSMALRYQGSSCWILKWSSEYSAGLLLAVRECLLISYLSLSVVLLNLWSRLSGGTLHSVWRCMHHFLRQSRSGLGMHAVLIWQKRLDFPGCVLEHGIKCQIIACSPERIGVPSALGNKWPLHECWWWYLFMFWLFRPASLCQTVLPKQAVTRTVNFDYCAWD